MFRLLSSDEQNRAAHLLELFRNRFVAARGMLRVLLSRYLELPPEKIVFRYAPGGKPLLASETMGRRCESDPSFNLSHSNDLALYAITLGREVGVDVEHVKPLHELETIAEQNFSPAEFDIFESVSPDKKLDTFYRYWTRKEAYIKAIGEGLSVPLGSFSVSPERGSPIQSTSSPIAPLRTSDWVFRDLRPSPEYIGSLAFKSPDVTLCMWTFASALEAFELLSGGDSPSTR